MYAVIAAAVIAVGTAILGQVFSAASKREAEKILNDAAREFNVPLPELKEWTAVQLNTTSWDAVPEDLGNKTFRDQAIRSLSEMGQQGGMDAGSRLALEEARRVGAATEAQGRASVNQEAARRGMGGASVVYGQLAAQQMGADRASMGGIQAASDARSRALQALSTGGAMAAQAEQQDFDRLAKINSSRDAINRYNADMAGESARYNNSILQQRYDNRMGQARAKYQLAQDQANIQAGHAAQTQAMWGGIGQGINMGLSAYQANKGKP